MGYESAIIGLLISLAFIALTGVFPGGIIVPSYLALFLTEPLRIGGTLIAALLALLTYRVASRYLILFGRRRLVVLILFGAIWALLWRQLLPSLFPLSLELRVIGWVIPGLIANHFERQGVVITTAALITVTVIIYLLGRMLAFL